jgi:hypothetical protein
MKICIYCQREAITVTSATTGCCYGARREWRLRSIINKLEEFTSHTYLCEGGSTCRCGFDDARAEITKIEDELDKEERRLG